MSKRNTLIALLTATVLAASTTFAANLWWAPVNATAIRIVAADILPASADGTREMIDTRMDSTIVLLSLITADGRVQYVAAQYANGTVLIYPWHRVECVVMRGVVD